MKRKNNALDKIMYDTKCAIKLAIAQLSAKYYISYKVLDTREHFSDNSTSYDKYINKNISLKIGIHTGKAISGVIGSVKPQYALFGDTVNTASRMKSTSLPDHIHVSYDTYKYLKEDNTFIWKERKVFIKGKGKMKTYLLVDILDDVKRKGESLNYYSSSNLLLSQLGSEAVSIYEEREDIKEGSMDIIKESSRDIIKEDSRDIIKEISTNISKSSSRNISKSSSRSISYIKEGQIIDKEDLIFKINRMKNKIDSRYSKRIDKESRDKISDKTNHVLDEVVKHSDIHLLNYEINNKRCKKNER